MVAGKAKRNKRLGGNDDAQFFRKLADERGFRRFAAFNLAAGKLP